MARPRKPGLSEPEVSIRARSAAKEIKRLLRAEIRRRELPMSRVATELGHSRAFLHNLFDGTAARPEINLKVDTLLALLEVLEISPAAFFGELQARGVLGDRAGSEGLPSPGLASTSGEMHSWQGVGLGSFEAAAAYLVQGLSALARGVLEAERRPAARLTPPAPSAGASGPSSSGESAGTNP